MSDINYATMTDAELLNMAPPPIEDVPQEHGTNFVDESVEEATGAEEAEQSEADDSAEVADEDGEQEDTSNESDSDEEQGSETNTSTTAEVEEETDTTDTDTDKELNADAQLARLFQPFKAGGREISIKNIDEAITLMQKGVGYHKKMESIKQQMNVVKMLENNGLLDQNKLNFLIDISQHKPEAIAKLVQDAGIEPYDLDTEKADSYKESSYAVDPKEVELDNVLDELRDTPSYTRMLAVVGTEWDADSRNVISNNPEVLRVINQHVETGIYDIIDAEMARQQALGNLNGMSNIEAYKAIGDQLNTEGKFNHLVPKAKETPKSKLEEAAAKLAKQAPKSNKDKAIKRKAAAVPTSSTSTPKEVKDFRNMSDEEFAVYTREQLMNAM